MYKKIRMLAAGLTLAAFLCGCQGTTAPELAKFKNDVNSFCIGISELDSSMNRIEASSDNAPTQLLGYLDEVDTRFQTFAQLDFPEEYDYLEPLADEAGSYMTEAVKYYHQAFADGSYSESTAEYAKENYSRAIKRVKIILAILRGENPNDPDVNISYAE